MAVADCLNTRLKNISGGTLNFSYLPPHGRVLADDGAIEIAGDLMTYFHTGGRMNKRKLDAFIADLEAGRLAVVHTPNPILFDYANTISKMLRLNSGTLSSADPCYGAYDGES